MNEKLNSAVNAYNEYSERGGSIEKLSEKYGFTYQQLQKFFSDLGFRYGTAPDLKKCMFYVHDYPYLQ